MEDRDWTMNASPPLALRCVTDELTISLNLLHVCLRRALCLLARKEITWDQMSSTSRWDQKIGSWIDPDVCDEI